MNLPQYDMAKEKSFLEEYADYFGVNVDNVVLEVWESVDHIETRTALYGAPADGCDVEWLSENGWVQWCADTNYVCKAAHVDKYLNRLAKEMDRAQWGEQLDDYAQETLDSYR